MDNVHKITSTIYDYNLKEQVEEYVTNIAIAATEGYIELSYELNHNH